MNGRFQASAESSKGYMKSPGRQGYPEYRNTHVTWLGEIPAHWRVHRLRDLLTRNDSGVWGDDFDPSGTVVLRSTDVTVDGDWRINNPARRQLGVKERQAAQLLEGDLVVTKSSGSADHLGKTAIATHDIAAQNCCFSNFMQRLRVTRRDEPRYIGRFLNSTAGREQLNYFGSTTTGLANLNGHVIGSIYIPRPPTAEQNTIANFLDRETTKIDALISKKERLIEMLQEKRVAIISQGVSKGLDPDAPMKDSRIEWLGEVPAHWAVKRVKWVAKMASGHTPDKKVDAYWENGDVPWVSLNDSEYLKSHDYISDTAFCTNELGLANSSARLLPERAVIFTRDATIGLCAITVRPMAVSQHLIAWICGPDILPEYLLRVFHAMAPELNRLTMGATLRTIGMPDVKTLTTPLPPRDEQVEITTFLRNSRERLDELVARIKDGISLLRTYRTTLISAAVTGKIDVRRVPHDP